MRPPLEMLVSLLGLAAGLVLAFAGYRLARGLAAIAGFLAGFVLGLGVGVVGGPVGMVVAALVLGVLFALVFALAFRLAGAVLGGAVAFNLAATLVWPPWGVALAVAVGILVGLVVNRATIVFATAITGAWFIVRHGVVLLSDAGVATPPLAFLGAIVALTGVGVLVQARELRREG